MSSKNKLLILNFLFKSVDKCVNFTHNINGGWR